MHLHEDMKADAYAVKYVCAIEQNIIAQARQTRRIDLCDTNCTF